MSETAVSGASLALGAIGLLALGSLHGSNVDRTRNRAELHGSRARFNVMVETDPTFSHYTRLPVVTRVPVHQGFWVVHYDRRRNGGALIGLLYRTHHSGPFGLVDYPKPLGIIFLQATKTPHWCQSVFDRLQQQIPRIRLRNPWVVKIAELAETEPTEPGVRGRGYAEAFYRWASKYLARNFHAPLASGSCDSDSFGASVYTSHDARRLWDRLLKTHRGVKGMTWEGEENTASLQPGPIWMIYGAPRTQKES